MPQIRPRIIFARGTPAIGVNRRRIGGVFGGGDVDAKLIFLIAAGGGQNIQAGAAGDARRTDAIKGINAARHAFKNIVNLADTQ